MNVKSIIKDLLCSKFVVNVIVLLFPRKLPNIRYSHQRYLFPISKFNYRVVGSLFWGFYEAAEMRLISSYLKKGFDVVELGSSAGVVSSIVSRKMSSNKKFICVEANPEMIPFIQENLKDENGVFILNKAIAYGKKEILFSIEDNHTSSRIQGDTTNNSSGMKLISTISLREIIDEYKLNEFVLVSDIEGAEFELIKNEGEILKNCKQIFIELHNDYNGAFNVEILKELISNLGFNPIKIDGNVFLFEKEQSVSE